MSTQRESGGLQRSRAAEASYHEHRYAHLLDTHVVPGVLWLDLGAGTRIHGGWRGVSQADLAGRARLLVGTDMVDQHLRKNSYLGAAVIADVTVLPFRTSTLDLVTANMLVEHLASPRRAFGEVGRVLKPGGRFLISTPNRQHPVVWGSALLVSRQSRSRAAATVEQRSPDHIFPTYYRCNTEDAIAALAEETGFLVDHVDLFNSKLFFEYVPGLRACERALNYLTANPSLRGFRSNILACLRRVAQQSGEPGASADGQPPTGM